MSKKVSAPEHRTNMELVINAKKRRKTKNATMSPLEHSKQNREKRQKRYEEKTKAEIESIEKNQRNFMNASYAMQADLDNLIYRRNLDILKENIESGKIKSASSSSASTSVSSGTLSSSVKYTSDLALSSKEMPYSEYILKYSKQYNLDPNLVASVITKESSWNSNAVSSANCQGLMQVNPKFHSGDLFDPEHNIATGCKILRECLDAYPTVDQALVAYNAGITGAKDTPSSTYSNKVLAEYNTRLGKLDDGNQGSSLSYYA